MLFNVLFDRDGLDEQANDFFDAPHMRGNTGLHRWRHAKGLVLADEVVIHEV